MNFKLTNLRKYLRAKPANLGTIIFQNGWIFSESGHELAKNCKGI